MWFRYTNPWKCPQGSFSGCFLTTLFNVCDTAPSPWIHGLFNLSTWHWLQLQIINDDCSTDFFIHKVTFYWLSTSVDFTGNKTANWLAGSGILHNVLRYFTLMWNYHILITVISFLSSCKNSLVWITTQEVFLKSLDIWH